MKDLELGKLLQSALLSLLLVLTISEVDSWLDRPPLEALQTHMQDLAFQSRTTSGQYQQVTPEDVVIILLDDESIAALGRTSLWSRAYDVKLLEFLASANPRAVGLDIVYSEPDTFGTIYHDLLAAQRIPNPKQILQAMEVDSLLEEALRANGRVYLGISSNDAPTNSIEDQQKNSVVRFLKLQGSAEQLTRMPNPQLPTDQLARAAYGVGSITIPQGADNIVRQYATLLDISSESSESSYLGSFALYLAADELEIPLTSIERKGRFLHLDNELKIPIQRDGTFRINWLGDQESIRHISFHKVIKGLVPPTFFKDKFVFVGTGGSGQADMKRIPSRLKNEPVPGVEVHANAFLNIVNKNFIREINGWSALLLLFALAVFLATFFSKLQPRYSLAMVVVLCLAEIILYFAWFFPTFCTTLPIVNIILITAVTYMFGLESARRRLKIAQERVTTILGQHVSDAVADKLLSTDDDTLVDRKFVCIMFLDIRQFTKFAESRAAEEIIAYQNQVFGFMIEAINKQGGIVNQIMGDGFMAIFGAPQPLPNACAAAYNSARNILEELEKKVNGKEIPHTRVGIGIHAGNVVAGSVGTRDRKQYSITGNPVIIAARLEELNKTLGSTLVMSKGVYDLLPTSVRDPLNFKQVEIRGRTEPMVIAYS